jgi:hypothetical protein
MRTKIATIADGTTNELTVTRVTSNDRKAVVLSNDCEQPVFVLTVEQTMQLVQALQHALHK